MWGGAPDRWTPTPASRTAWHPIAPAPAPPVAAAHRLMPVGWDRPQEPERAEPTDGRHAFDRDAALTPIFTALRRGGRRRARPEALPLRLAPEPAEYRRSDPPTAPIPVIPALHAVDPYPSGGYPAATVDPYDTGGHRRATVDPYAGPPRVAPPPSDNETTTVWYFHDDPMAYSPATDTGRHHRRLAPAGW
jgi:hypothetical protein